MGKAPLSKCLIVGLGFLTVTVGVLHHVLAVPLDTRQSNLQDNQGNTGPNEQINRVKRQEKRSPDPPRCQHRLFSQCNPKLLPCCHPGHCRPDRDPLQTADVCRCYPH